MSTFINAAGSLLELFPSVPAPSFPRSEVAGKSFAELYAEGFRSYGDALLEAMGARTEQIRDPGRRVRALAFQRLTETMRAAQKDVIEQYRAAVRRDNEQLAAKLAKMRAEMLAALRAAPEELTKEVARKTAEVQQAMYKAAKENTKALAESVMERLDALAAAYYAPVTAASAAEGQARDSETSAEASATQEPGN